MNAEIQKFLIFVAAWCTFHFVLVLIRLPFSGEKVGRLKLYGMGLGFVIGALALGWLAHYVLGQGWFEKLLTPETLGIPEFAKLFLMIILAAGETLGLFLMFSLIIGHAATMWSSWISDDTGVWSQTN
jgi:hypothetical protein